MRWGPFWLTLLLVTVLQTTLVFVFHWHWLHLPLALALLCALNAPTPDARLAAWTAGLAQDLCTESATLGLHAFAFGLGALCLTSLRDRLKPTLWWGRCLLAVAGAWTALAFIELYFRWWLGREPVAWSWLAGTSVRDAAIAAVLAVLCTELPWFLPRGRTRRYAAAR